MRRNLLGFLFGKMARNSMLRSQQLKHNLPTPAQFIPLKDADFATEKKILSDMIRRFGDTGPAVITNKKHPFFGSMDDSQWGVLQYKHLDHHLRQFGV